MQVEQKKKRLDIVEFVIKRITTREGMSFPKVNFRIGCHGKRVRRPFIQPAFHQLHVRGEARFPPSLSLSFVPFRALTIATHDCRSASLPRVIPLRHSSLLLADARCTRRTARKRAREGVDIKDEGGERAQGQRVKGEKSLTFHGCARA